MTSTTQFHSVPTNLSSTGLPQGPAMGPNPFSGTGSSHSERPPVDTRTADDPMRAARDAAGNLRQWLVDQRNAGQTPAQIASTLMNAGWDADAAARTALRSLRSVDRHTLTYAMLNLGSGFAALGAATSAHLLINGNQEPDYLTTMVTLTLVAAPIAGIAAYFARKAERQSRFVMWSPSRRGWFGALALCTATVGIVRLVAYLYQAIATLTGASQSPFSWAAAGQVLTSLAVSIPLFVWSFVQWRRSNIAISALGDDGATTAP